MWAWLLFQNRPGINIRPFEASQPKLASTWIKAVMLVTPIGVKHQARRAGFIVKLDADSQFKGNGRHRHLGKTQRAAAEAIAEAVRDDLSGTLAPAAIEDDRPVRRIECDDGQPVRHRNRVRFLQKRLDAVDRQGKTVVGRQEIFHRQNLMHPAVHLYQLYAT